MKRYLFLLLFCCTISNYLYAFEDFNSTLIHSGHLEASFDIDKEILKAKNESARLKNKNKKTLYIYKVRHLAHFYSLKFQYNLTQLELNKLLSDKDLKLSFRQRCLIEIELAFSYKIQLDFDEALKHYLNSKNAQKKVKDPKLKGVVYAEIAEYYRSIGKYKECRKNVEIALKTLSNAHLINSDEYYFALSRKAAYFTENAFLDSSIFYSEKVYSYSKRTNNYQLLASSLNEMAYCYQNKNDFEKAMSLYEIAEKSLENTFYKTDLAHIKYSKALCFSKSLGNFNHSKRPQAIEYFQDVKKYVVQNKIVYSLEETYLYILTQYHHLMQLDSMFKYQKLRYEERLIFIEKKNSTKIQEIEQVYQNKELLLDKRELKANVSELKLTNERQSFYFKLMILIVLFVSIITFILVRTNRKTKRSNLLLKESNELKDVLLKEIHHRVKNNMQMVSGILDIQSDYTKDEMSKDALHLASDRINSIAFAHKNLYLNDDYTNIPLKEYIESIIKNLSGGSQFNYKLNIDEQLVFEIEKAQSIGFILNELVTNSLKHAWKESNSEKMIKVKILYEKKSGLFEYSDNGVGINNENDLIKSDSLGVTLIHSFVERQLNGSIKYNIGQGFRCQILFNIK